MRGYVMHVDQLNHANVSAYEMGAKYARGGAASLVGALLGAGAEVVEDAQAVLDVLHAAARRDGSFAERSRPAC